MHALARDLGLEQRVHWPGFVQYPDLPTYYALADAFILPSTIEPWGLVVNEAMACGLPVLVSDRCGCAPDLVQEGGNGFTFKPRPAGSIADALARLPDEPAALAAMGEASRRIVAGFSPEAFGQGLFDAVQLAVERTGRDELRKAGGLGMKLAFMLSSISRANGGISESVRRLAQSLRDTGSANVAVASLRDAFTDADRPLWAPLDVQCAPVLGPRALGYAPGLRPALARIDPDVSHAAGLWMYPSVAHHRWARRARRPYLVSPHGMLDAWALRNSAWKKNLAGRLFERAHLEQASCLHALCAAEADAIRAYGLKNPICVLPNGVDLPAAVPDAPAWAGRIPAGRRVMLFLGRIHPKKGLMNLLQAWTRLPADAAWQLVIAGWDQGGHQRELEQFVEAHALRDRVTFVGPLHGPAKAAAYAHARAFILPSFSEGLPMTVLEAWAHGRPVLMTAACNLPEGFTEGAAVEISTDPEIMARSLLMFMSAGEPERAAWGLHGRALAQNQFNWTRIAGEMLSVYRWVTGAGPRPGCVHI